MKKILIVDDDDVFHFMNRKMISIWNPDVHVTVAFNGLEALERLRVTSPGDMPDLIFLDLDMPLMDGFQFVSVFNDMSLPNKDTIRIVILSSSDDLGDKVKASSLGVTDFLSKPLTIDALNRLARSQN